MQTEYEVITVQVDETCDVCNRGLMRPTGMQLMSNPPWYVHACTNCKRENRYRSTFPRIEYRKKYP